MANRPCAAGCGLSHMGTFDDVDLERAEGWSEPPRHGRRGPLLAAGIAVLLLAALAGWWWWPREPAAESSSATQAESPPPPPAGSRASAEALPGLNELDPLIRELVASLTSSNLLTRWLATDDLARQIAALVGGAARSEVPLRLLEPLRPSGRFVVAQRGGRTVVDEATYRRSEPLASVIASLDPAAVASVYRRIAPRLEDAYAELGEDDRTFDLALREALEQLIDTPVPKGQIEVQGRAGIYFYADPDLESLTPAQKLLLRTGPDNMRRVQEQLRAFRAELDKVDPPTS